MIENVKKEKCTCGKTIETFDTIVKSPQGENVRKHHGYPELFCHCKCGIAWGKHGELNND